MVFAAILFIPWRLGGPSSPDDQYIPEEWTSVVRRGGENPKNRGSPSTLRFSEGKPYKREPLQPSQEKKKVTGIRRYKMEGEELLSSSQCCTPINNNRFDRSRKRSSGCLAGGNGTFPTCKKHSRHEPSGWSWLKVEDSVENRWGNRTSG